MTNMAKIWSDKAAHLRRLSMRSVPLARELERKASVLDAASARVRENAMEIRR